MKKVTLILVGLAIIILGGSCSYGKSCPAYSDNTIEVEQKA